MSRPAAPVWVWVIAGFIVLRIASEAELNLVPLVIIGFVLWKVVGQGRRGTPGTLQRQQLPTPPPVAAPGPTDTAYPTPGGMPSTPAQPGASPMPRIEVPSYPGATSSVGSDPSVSLAQLQLAQVGRDLEAAAATGDAQRVDAALRRVAGTVDQVQVSLQSVSSPAGRAVRASLDGLRAAVREALDSPPASRAALVQRVVGACRG